MPRPFVVLTALQDETDAIMALVQPSRAKMIQPSAFGVCRRVFVLRGGRRRSGIVAQFGGTGRMYSAVATMQAIRVWSPAVLFLVGTAGGFRNRGIALGDVVIATDILDYEAQRIGLGAPIARGATFKPNAALLEIAKSARERFARPESVHFGPILSGDKVIASEIAVQRLQEHHQRAIGVEMEGAGVAFSVSQMMTTIPFLMVRGVADHADEKKSEDCRIWSRVACDAAARFSIDVLESWAIHASNASEQS